jgi:hypothetical protein
MRNYSTSIFLIASSVMMISVSIAFAQNGSGDGYILLTDPEMLQLQAIDISESMINPLIESVQINESQDVVQFAALSPNSSYLASILIDSEGSFILLVTDLKTGGNIQHLLPMTQDPQFGYIINWSPDSSRLLLSPSSLLESTQLFDLQTQRLMPIEAEYGLGFQWLPNSTQFVFNGLPVCGTLCGVYSDVYLGTYSTQNVDIQPLTRLNINNLNLAGYVPRIDVALGLLTYNPNNNRIYGTIGDDPSNPGGFELLYSVDLQGNVQLEADIGALKPDAVFASQILKMFYNPLDNAMYLVVRTEGTRSNGEHIKTTVLRYSPGTPITSIFEFTSPDTNIPVDFSMSPDGQFLALGGADISGLEAGNLVVLDLFQGEIVLQVNGIRPVCQVSWATDSTDVLFTQTQAVPCARFYENQPVNQLMMVHVATQEITTVYEADQSSFYFLSPGY